MKMFEKMAGGNINGEEAFVLFTTYGFPIELTLELAKERGLSVDINDYNERIKKHQELSRTASAGKFKGGLAEHTEKTTQYHTATHMLGAALRQVLGSHVAQKGSNITSERLRFDFSHPSKMSDQEKKKVEDLVNQKIAEAFPVSFEILPIDEARSRGAIGQFGEKYGDSVKVYKIGDESRGVFSYEICGGPHVSNTSELGHFKIQKEEACSAGVRRIKAILE
jgi:alanyl-tRNA synthetase